MAYYSINEHKADVIRDKDGKANPYVARIEDVKTFDDKYSKSKTYGAWFMVALREIERPICEAEREMVDKGTPHQDNGLCTSRLRIKTTGH